MNKNALEILEFDKIKENLKAYALSEMAIELIEKLEPYIDLSIIERLQKEVEEGREIINKSSSVPLHSLTGIGLIKVKVGKTGNLMPEELETISGLLREGKRMKRYMLEREEIAPLISSYAYSIFELENLAEEIDRCIYHGRVDDKASSTLSRIRKKISIAEGRIKEKIDTVMRNPKYKAYIQDNIVSMRNGRYVIPVKSQYKANINGAIHDSSSSGSTVFLEPEEIKKAQDELNLLKIQEEKEIYKILSELTLLVEEHWREITINVETMVNYDFIFSKAKYSKAIDGRSVKFNTSNYINIKAAKHPLIGRNAVPLDFTIGDDYKALIITGPNTGGKTVALKTVGLLTIMAQSGLHISVAKDSELAVFIDVLADIGDGQSIEQNLSTFSSHIKNIISIIECADPYTLVIMDEVGAGTDPGEGMGIATAVMEEIYKKGSIIIATTHYSEIKEFAESTKGFKNGCMEFDINTLKPLYKLVIGKAGASNAFLIALRLGMKHNIIEKAHSITYKEIKKYDDYNESILGTKIVDEDAISNHQNKIDELKRVIKTQEISEKQKAIPRFKLGDCVYISTMDRTGVVCELENNKGEVGVMVMKKKFKINHKRLSLYIAGDELYPENYDYDIVFESVENRKKNKLMNKKHVEGMTIEIDK